MVNKSEFIIKLLVRLQKTLDRELPDTAPLDEMHDEFVKIIKGKFFLTRR
jgi:hypothetical protein